MIYLRLPHNPFSEPVNITSTQWAIDRGHLYEGMYATDEHYKGLNWYIPVAATCLEKW